MVGSASANASAESALRHSGKKVFLDTKLNVGKLALEVKAEVAWGLFEYANTWQVWEGYNKDTETEVLDFS